MPCFFAIGIVNIKQSQKCKSGLELKNQEIPGLKILRHKHEISISTLFANKIKLYELRN